MNLPHPLQCMFAPVVVVIVVVPRGLEPPAISSGGRCSAAELRNETSTAREEVGKAGPPGIEPGHFGLQPNALPTKLQTEKAVVLRRAAEDVLPVAPGDQGEILRRTPMSCYEPPTRFERAWSQWKCEMLAIASQRQEGPFSDMPRSSRP